jgi:hypothetical protein
MNDDDDDDDNNNNNNNNNTYVYRHISWNSSIDVATGYGLDDRGLIPGRSKRFFSAPQLLYRI